MLTKGLTEFVKQVIKEPCFGEYIFNNSKTMKPYFELKDQWTNACKHVGIKGYSFRILSIHSQHAWQQKVLVLLSLCRLCSTKIQSTKTAGRSMHHTDEHLMTAMAKLKKSSSNSHNTCKLTRNLIFLEKEKIKLI